MARKRGGFKAPGNYEPNRGKKRRGVGGAPAKRNGTSAASDAAPQSGGGPRSQAASRSTPRSASHTAPKSAAQRAAQSREPRALTTPPKLHDAVVTRADDVSVKSFSELGLGGNIVRALAELGATAPFAIQAVTIPEVLQGHHVLGRDRTGSGKTIAFGAALVERLMQLKREGVFPPDPPRVKQRRGVGPSKAAKTAKAARGTQSSQGSQGSQPAQQRPPKALILAPTRELALQIDRTVQPLARSVGLYTAQLVGGQPFEPQLHALRRGIDIVIGTPGRIEDLIGRGHLNLSHVAVTVIDEADHMSELGFIDAVQRILRRTRRGGQRLLFSATLDQGVDELVREFMPQPAIHEVIDGSAGSGGGGATGDFTGAGDRYVPADQVEHAVYLVLREDKDTALIRFAKSGGRSIVFCRTRAYVEHVAELLSDAGLSVTALHGDIAQAKRERNLARFSEGKAQILVATDVAARGIHVDDVDLVLQADPPDDPKAYVHRAGRTGRVGRPGRVVTLIPRTRQKRTRELFEQLGFEPDAWSDFV